MTENRNHDEQPQPIYLAVEVGESCYRHHHQVEPQQDLVTCIDCMRVVSAAINDGMDPAEALAALRAWTPQEMP